MTEQYINRELSWLKFNERVLEEAEDERNPLIERAKFVAIFCSNLDEFFMVRVGSLKDQSIVSGIIVDNKTGKTPHDQLQDIYRYVKTLIPRKDAAYLNTRKALQEKGLVRVMPGEFKEKDEEFIERYFKTDILPLISPQIIDKRHPFPFLKNMQLYIGVQLSTKGKYLRFGIIPISEIFPRIVLLPGKQYRYVIIEDLILHFVDKVFKKFTVLDRTVFKITRNADLQEQEALFDEDADYREVMQDLLKIRTRLRPVRLDIYQHVGGDLVKYLEKKLGLDSNQVYVNEAPLDLGHTFKFDKSTLGLSDELFFPQLTPRNPMFLEPKKPIIPQVEAHDVFLSYPYESINHFIRLLNEAACDPYVVSIKVTLYRVAKNSKVIDALIKAHENGKEVFAVVELRARFDEQNNIDWAIHLEEAGIGLSYGLDDYKTHSKLLLISRRTPEGIELITQIGTGNYNEKTATQYSDMSLITVDPDIGEDAVDFFRNISTGTTTRFPKKLLIAPESFKSRILEMIDSQIEEAKCGNESLVILKTNALTDKEIIDKLIEASKAGVPIKLIIRGICCIKSGIPGVSDNIEVISIVGRYLEHSRVYSFGCGESQVIYISSGDLMTRSTTRRVEIAAPILDPDIKAELNNYLSTQLRDNVKARRQLPDGSYEHVKDDNPPLDSQVCNFIPR